MKTRGVLSIIQAGARRQASRLSWLHEFGRGRSTRPRLGYLPLQSGRPPERRGGSDHPEAWRGRSGSRLSRWSLAAYFSPRALFAGRR